MSSIRNNTTRLRLVVVTLCIVTVGTVALTVYKHFATQRSVSASLMKQIIEKGETNFVAFFRPISINLDLMRKWGQSGLLNTSDPKGLNDKLVPILQAIPHMYSIMIATDSALEYALVRDGKGWRTRVPGPSDNKEAYAFWQRLGIEGEMLEKWKDEKQLIPMRKTWFRGALAAEANEIYWTAPHALYPDSRIGITAATQGVRKGVKYVAAIGILMEDVRSALDVARVGDSTRFFLYSHNRVAIDFQRSDSSYTANARNVPGLFGVNGTDDPLIKDAVETWVSALEPDEPFKLHYERTPWWGFLVALRESRKGGAIGMLMPERALLSQQEREGYFFVLVALGILWVGFFWYMKMHSRGASMAAQDDALLNGTEEALL
jgi:hypothetical protein